MDLPGLPMLVPWKGVESAATPYRTKVCHKLLVGSTQASRGSTQEPQRNPWSPHRLHACIHRLHRGPTQAPHSLHTVSIQASTGFIQASDKYTGFTQASPRGSIGVHTLSTGFKQSPHKHRHRYPQVPLRHPPRHPQAPHRHL